MQNRHYGFSVVLIALVLVACGGPFPTPTPDLSLTTSEQFAPVLTATARAQPPLPTARPPETPEALLGQRAEPYAPTCGVTPFTGLEKRRGFPAWWLIGNGLRAGVALGNLYAGDNKVQWQPDQMGPYGDTTALIVSATPLGRTDPPAELRNPQNIGTGYSTTVFFPQIGCWQVRARVGTQTLDATVYVYPGACRSDYTGTVACAPPPADAGAVVQANSGACAVTLPPNPPLRPPPLSPPTDVGTAGFWYGNDALWLTLLNSGTMLQDDKQYIWRIVPGPLTVEGRRLDAPAAPLDADIPQGYGDLGGQAVGLNFPTTGCWEVVARVSGRELRFVVNVVPRPDYPATATAASAATTAVMLSVDWGQLHRPWQMPMLAAGDVCPVTPRQRIVPSPFDSGGGRGPVYALGYGDVVLGSGGPSPVALKTFWVARNTYVGPVLIRGRQLDSPGTLAFTHNGGPPEPEMRLTRSEASSDKAEDWRQWPSLTYTPGPGCYAFQIDGDGFTDTVVFMVRA